jgi:hypothetical protein
MPPRNSQPLQIVTTAIQNPVGGVIRSKAWEEPSQVPSLTSSLNVLPYDLLGRKRIGQRPGVIGLYNLNDFGAHSTFIQGMLQIGSIVQPGAVIFPASTLFWSTWTQMPWSTGSGNRVLLGSTSTASTSFSFPSTQTLTVSFTANWHVDNTGGGSGLVGTNFGVGVTSPVDEVHNRGILDWGAGMFVGTSGSSTFVGGEAGLFTLNADPSTTYLFNSGTYTATGSYTFTGQYTYNAVTNKIHAVEKIVGSQTQQSTGDFTLVAATGSTVFHGWQNLYVWNQQGIDGSDTLQLT